MSDLPYFLVPIKDLLPAGAWPEDVASTSGKSGDALDSIWRAEISSEVGKDYMLILATLAILDELEFPLPLINGVSFIFGGPNEGASKYISLRFALGDVPEDDFPDHALPNDLPPSSNDEDFVENGSGFELDLETATTSLTWFAEASCDALGIRFSRDLITPVIVNPTGEVEPIDGFVQINFGCSIKVGNNGDVEFSVADDEGTSEEGTIEFTISNSSFWIGDTRVVLTIDGIALRFSPTASLPTWASEDLGRGVYIEKIGIGLPADLRVSLLPSDLIGRKMAFTSGGFSGIIEGVWNQRLADSRKSFVPNPGAGDLFGMAFALSKLDFEFKQNTFIRSSLSCDLIPPLIEKPLGLTLSIGNDGTFIAQLAASELCPDITNEGLIKLRQENLFDLTVSSAKFEVRNEVSSFALSGSIQPLLAGFDWPTFDIQKFSINSNGEVDLDGGWIDLPETCILDFQGFKIDISQFGIGSEEREGEERQWIGLSGGITLVEGIPLSASVEGLKISWNPKQPPTAADPLRGVEVSLNGIAVHLEIPNTLILDGAVSYREIRPEHDLAKRTGISGHIFTGSVTIDLQALRTEVNAELLIGEIKDATGRSFTAFYIVLSAELPTAIPLGATGTGIYALQGLFGLHVAPDRRLTDGTPEAWYTWYKEDRGNDSDYSVTKVAKWAPRFDNYAFGAGLTLGTQFDDGFSINVGALVVVLIPGPVIMIEGRANFLKPRSGNGKQAQGALYALAVFDGLAATFQLNIDVQYDLEDVVAIQGGMECFFDFNDASRWYINLGRKDPESKRIQVSLLAILRASFYLMLSNSGIQTGAMVGFDFRANYGPVELKLIARIVVEAAIFWSPLQFEGKLELYGELSLKIFGIGIGLIIQALLEGKSPSPFWLHGLFRVALSLPFPLPSFDFQVELTLADDPTPPEPVTFLDKAVMAHHKLPGVAWELSETPANPTLVPIDSRPLLLFNRPIADLSISSDTNELVRYDRVDDWKFIYRYTNIELWEKLDTSTPQASDVIQDINGERYRLLKQSPLTTSDLSSATSFNISRDSLLPTPDAQQPQLQLWGNSPLDLSHRYWRENFPGRYPACRKRVKAETYYVFWAYTADETQYPLEFIHQNLRFVVDLPDLSTVNVPASVVPKVQYGSLSTPKLTIQLPELSSWLQILIVKPEILDSKTRIRLGLGGEQNPPPLSLQCFGYRRGRSVGTFALSDFPGDARFNQITVDAEIDTLRLIPKNYSKILIYLIQYKTLEETTVERLTGSDPLEEERRTRDRDRLILSPGKHYCLKIQTSTQRQRLDDNPSPAEINQKSFYFEAGDGPSKPVPQPETPSGSTNGSGSQPSNYLSSVVNELGTYVAQTLPHNGAKQFYYGYDIALEFNEPYVEAMYQSPLKMQVRDRNQKSQGIPQGNWLNTLLPLLPAGLLTWLRAKQSGGCLSSETNPALKVPSLRRSLPSTLKPKRLYTVDVVLDSNPNTSLYSFQFATSYYKNIQEHLQSGKKEGEYEIVRPLGSTTAPDLTWMGNHQAKLEEFGRERQTLQTLNLDDIRNLPQISEQLTKTRAALDSLNQASANQFTKFYEALGLTFRPLPPCLEFSEIRINSTNNRFLLLESPEPIEWSRVVIKYREREIDIPIQVLWNDDQARAFILRKDTGWLTTGKYDFEFKYCNGRDCPDLSLVTVNNEIPSIPPISLKVRLS